MLELIPMTLSDASEFCAQHHRHHKPPRGGLFAVGCAEGETVRGVAIVGRPVARGNQDGWTAEVTRVATDGARNACSMLYGACWRAARALGYRKLITYTLADEPGASLRAAGWKIVGQVTGRSWACKSRPRVDRHPLQDKIRWEASALPPSTSALFIRRVRRAESHSRYAAQGLYPRRWRATSAQ